MEAMILKILEKLNMMHPGLNQNELRNQMRMIMDDYDITPKTRALALNTDMNHYIGLFLATRMLDGLSPKTLSEYRLKLTIFHEWVPLNINQVTAMDIRRFLAQYGAERNLKNSSLNNFQTVIRTFFSWLQAEDYIMKSPANKLQPIKHEKRTRKSLTSEQLEVLRLEGCKSSRDRAIIEMFFSTGGRLEEIRQIDIDKINWSENSVSVIGKGNKERTVYFSDKTKVYLRKYLRERGFHESKALFVSKIAPFTRLSGRSIQSIINKIGDNAGFDFSVYPHLLRHTMATLGYKSGIELPIIQELLGHSDPQTTMIYTEMDKTAVMEAHRRHMSM